MKLFKIINSRSFEEQMLQVEQKRSITCERASGYLPSRPVRLKILFTILAPGENERTSGSLVIVGADYFFLERVGD